MYWKRYAFVFGIGLILANVYTFWPAFAYGNRLINCPSIFGNLSYEVRGAAQVVGAPIFRDATSHASRIYGL